jgi:hypothetical protein
MKFEFSELANKLPFGYDLDRIIDDAVRLPFFFKHFINLECVSIFQMLLVSLFGNDFIRNLPFFENRKHVFPKLHNIFEELKPELYSFFYQKQPNYSSSISKVYSPCFTPIGIFSCSNESTEAHLKCDSKKIFSIGKSILNNLKDGHNSFLKSL